MEEDGTLDAAGFDETDIGDLLSRLEDDEEPEPESPEPLVDHTPPPADPVPPPEIHNSASVKDAGPSLADESEAYEESRTRVIMLNYAMPIYTYVHEHLTRLAQEMGVLPADVVLELISERTGVTAPVID